MEVLDLIKKYKYHIFIAFNLLWVWALLSPNIYYFDDNYRAAGGYYNWGGDFRPFADWLYYILGLGRRFTDLTPLPQIFALVFLYYTYYSYVKKYSDEKINITILLTFLPIVWSPFLLSNLYFRYDSIFMMLAVLLSVLAIFDVDNKKYFRAIILIFIACGFYQPAIVAYICTALFLVYNIRDNEKNKMLKLLFKQSFIYFIVFVAGIALYYLTIMKFTTEFNFYSATHSQMSIKNLIPNIINATNEVGVLFQGDTGFIFFAIFTYLLLINLIYFIKKFSYFGIVVFTIMQIGFVFSAAGVNLLLEIPKFEYRTLIFYGFYISYLLLSALYVLNIKSYKNYNYSILFFVIFYFLSISLYISNMLKDHSYLENYLVLDIITNIDKLKLQKYDSYIFYGEYKDHIVRTTIDKYPISKKFISNNTYVYKIKNFFPYLNYNKFKTTQEKQIYIKNNKKYFKGIMSTKFYTIYEYQNSIIIYFIED